MPSISSRLIDERKALGLSQQALADRVGISARSQRNYESGERSPDADYLAALAALGIDVAYVLTGGHLSAHQQQAIKGARAFTEALPVGAADKQHLHKLNDQAELQTASTNASRADDYAQITELLAGSSDETVALVLQLVARLYLADLPKAARGGQR